MSDPPKRRVALLAGILVVVMLTLIAIPNFVPARFTSSGVPLVVRVQVTDQDGVPIEGATVYGPSRLKSAVTGEHGECEINVHFPAHGSVGRSGTMHLGGNLEVTAHGYRRWERSFVSLLGHDYDYFNRGKVVTHTVVVTSEDRSDLPSSGKPLDAQPKKRTGKVNTVRPGTLDRAGAESGARLEW